VEQIEEIKRLGREAAKASGEMVIDAEVVE
jgi:hypothetical protein